MIFKTIKNRKSIKKYISKIKKEKLFFTNGDGIIEDIFEYPSDVIKLTVCIKNGKIIGHVFNIDNMYRYDCDYDVLVYVKKKHRRRGIGTFLVKKHLKKEINNKYIGVFVNYYKKEKVNREKFWNKVLGKGNYCGL